jgi:hypothetical protein
VATIRSASHPASLYSPYQSSNIHLTNQASKGKSGRMIVQNKELKKQLVKVKEINGIDTAGSRQFVIRTRAAARDFATGCRELIRRMVSEARICRVFKSQRKAQLYYASSPKGVVGGWLFA